MPSDRSFQLLEGTGGRLEASPDVPRRRWSEAAKARLVEEALDPAANVSAIARRHGIAPSQLFGWRRQALKAGSVERDEVVSFAQVQPVLAQGSIEIVIGDAMIKIGADVDARQLQMVLRAVRAR
jgi:transposase